MPQDTTEEIVTELGTCLRLIECSEETPAELSDALKAGVYDAWERARQSIFDAWTIETDPANLQPKLRPLNRAVAEFLRNHPPRDIEQERLNRAVDAVETPWSRREENQVRKVWKQEIDSDMEQARALIERIEEIGIEPFEAPEPLPPIGEDEIHVVCWMGIEAQADRTAPVLG